MHKFTLILSLLLISSALSKIHSSFSTDPSFLNPKTPSSSKKLSATKSGNVPLYKDDAGFYVEVDLIYDSTTKSGSVIGPDTVPMMLSLYTSQTLLTENCLDFSVYDCKDQKYNCKSDEKDVDNRNYFSFTPASYWGKTNLYLDYVNFGFQSDVLFATNCLSGAEEKGPYGKNRYGVLGLGTSLDGKANFNASSPVFSIAIADDFKSGELLFKKDLENHAESSHPVAVLKASRDWVSALTGTVEIGKKTFALNAKLIFDLSSDSIGLPLDMYNQVMKTLEDFGVKDCTAGSTYQPKCTYLEKYEDLPDITLDGGDAKVVIPPKVYVLNYKEQTYVTLNLKGMSNNLPGPSFVTPTYLNYISLDWRFMNSFYTVFEYQNGDGTTVSLYKAGKGGVDPDDGGSYWWIVLVVLAVILVGCAVAYFIKKKTDERKSNIDGTVGAPYKVAENSY